MFYLTPNVPNFLMSVFTLYTISSPDLFNARFPNETLGRIEQNPDIVVGYSFG